MNITEDYVQQFLNSRKVEERNNRTGQVKVIWKKTGKNDYRMADVHTFIALDLDTEEYGSLRRCLEVADFKLNPYESVQYCSVPELPNKSKNYDPDCLPEQELNWF